MVSAQLLCTFSMGAKRKTATRLDHHTDLTNPGVSTLFMFYERFAVMY